MRNLSRLCLLGISLTIILGCAASKQAIEYMTLAPDVQVLRLWEISKPEWPQMAHIRLLSKEAHEQFHRDPVSFINRHQIFPYPISQQVGECLRPIDVMKALGNQVPTAWRATVEHYPANFAGTSWAWA